MRDLEDLDVFVSSDQKEFTRKRRRLEKKINNMPYLSCELLENRGADSDNTEESSIKAARRCDFYIGIFGKKYSMLTQIECLAALGQNKRNLIYVLDINDANRDSRVSEFINTELSSRVKYHKFRNCKGLEEQIEKDLRRQVVRILRTGLDVMAHRKEEIGNKEKELKDSIYSSSSPSDIKEISSILRRAKLNYDSGDYLPALINTSTYIELLLRRAVTEANNKDYSKISFHVLLREAERLNLFSKQTIMNLKDFWPVRNKAIHEGLIPTRDDTRNLLYVANLLERDLSSKLESSPILTERDRRIIATRFMKRLCELDLQARQNALPNKFSIDKIWRHNLDGYNLSILGPYTLAFFRDKLNFIDQDSSGNVLLSNKGAKHCGEEIVLPAGI